MTAISKMADHINGASVVVYEALETKCDSKVVAWYYMRANGRMYYRPQAPGVEYRVKNIEGVVAVWPWDGSWSKWWEMLIEAWALGLCDTHLKKLAAARGCDNKNALFFGKNFGITMYQDGPHYVTQKGRYLTKSRNYLAALGKMCVKLGYVGHPESSLHFLDLLKQA